MVGFEAEAVGIKEYLFKHSHATDACTEEVNTNLFRCKDGTLSFAQTDSLFDSGGTCGQVAVANVIANLCHTSFWRPEHIDFKLDPPPGGGTSLLELTNAIDELAGTCALEGWSVEYSLGEFNLDLLSVIVNHAREKTQSMPLGLNRGFSIVVLQSTEKEEPPYVTTVVNVNSNQSDGRCSVVHNTWGIQFSTPCDVFRDLASVMSYPIIWHQSEGYRFMFGICSDEEITNGTCKALRDT